MAAYPDNTIQPVYAIDGKRLASVTGIFKHLIKKHPGAASVGCIGADRILRVYGDRPEKSIVASYQCSKPEVGKDVLLTCIESAA